MGHTALPLPTLGVEALGVLRFGSNRKRQPAGQGPGYGLDCLGRHNPFLELGGPAQRLITSQAKQGEPDDGKAQKQGPDIVVAGSPRGAVIWQLSHFLSATGFFFSGTVKGFSSRTQILRNRMGLPWY